MVYKALLLQLMAEIQYLTVTLLLVVVLVVRRLQIISLEKAEVRVEAALDHYLAALELPAKDLLEAIQRAISTKAAAVALVQ